MATNFEELIVRQKESFERIKQICTNFKKDSVSRKTSEYLDTRLDALRAHWQEFEMNHKILLQLECKEQTPYFSDDVYGKTKEMCDDTVLSIMKLKSELFMTQSNPTPSKRMITVPAEDPQDDSKAKRQELLRHQQCNFKLFRRTISKIDIKTLAEKWELDDALNNLKSKWEAIEKINFQLEYLASETDYFYEQEFNEMEYTYEDIKKQLNQKIWNNVHFEKSTPRVQIPDFKGEYTNWISFKDLFMEGIHNNPLLAKTQKMQHLKSKLKGEAEKLVQHLSIGADNYDTCWEILTHRYDNHRLLVTSYMNTLLNQQMAQQGNAQTIKKLHDTSVECLNGLTNIGLEITSAHPIIAHLIMKKLDNDLCAEYIKDLKVPREMPNLEELLEFLESKFVALETLDSDQHSRTSNHSSQFTKKYNYDKKPIQNRQEKVAKTYYTSYQRYCPMCKVTGHVLMQCDKFIDMNSDARNNTVAKLRLCKNCLFGHNRPCTSEKRCKTCNESHHTLLHNNSGNSISQPNQHCVNNITDDKKEILLTTVQLQVKNIDGEYVTLRALLDQGSMVSLLTEDAAQYLRLPRRKLSAIVSGVGNINGNCKGSLLLECKSLYSAYTFQTEALIMSKLINKLPTTSFSTRDWSYLDNIKLADPQFNISGPIDMLLGADVYSELILDGVMKSEHNYPIAQQTKIGWILCGNVKTFQCCVTLNELENISKFWETEDIRKSDDEINEREYCEKYYLETTERQSNGRYIVKMPMKANYEQQLGISKPQALSQFYQLEKRMEKQKYFATQYKLFIKEYMDMGHMTLDTSKIRNKPSCYLPHHGVIKEESTTTKLRVVFNGSMKTSSKLSLNDLMYTGPNLQKDIQELIINWRTHKYSLVADVEKMYRNIMLHEDQQHLQKILWRESPQQPIQEMKLCTLTYGLRASPYLAIRTLHQLARDDGHKYPNAAQILENYLFMDDLVYGVGSIMEGQKLIHDLIALMKGAGFNLRKWASNEPSLLENIPYEQRCQTNVLDFKNEHTSSNTKTLGLRWNPKEDYLYFDYRLPASNKPLTKRKLLSEISSLYDPLGWLSPIIIQTKLLFQKLWLNNLGWDDAVPPKEAMEWEELKNDLQNINKLKLLRWMNGCTEKSEIELFGFSDASEKAYAAVVYSRTQNEQGNLVITLVIAKTRVAGLRTKLSIPQMELCGALLLSKLIEKVRCALKRKAITYNCWTDSKVVLAWLQRDYNKLERYIANRVKQIINTVPVSRWNYVKSKDNPADCASRGLSPSKLISFTLWWKGPQWLKTYNEEKNLELKQIYYTEIGTIKTSYATTYTDGDNTILTALLAKCSTMTRVIRVVSWIRRFISALRNNSCTNKTNYLSHFETSQATEMILKHVQEQHFGPEISQVRRTGRVTSRSNILKLNPYLDELGLLRVGGRLRNSDLPYEAKHPIILPPGRMTELLIDYYHKLTLHGGARLTLAQIREKYWILSGNNTVKKRLRNCVKCHRFKTHKTEQIMGDLPKARVIPSRSFSRAGVDFTGHVELKINKGKGVRTCKGYIAIFVCMVTKAVHLELVSDLSTESFLAALKRMCSRRGTPQHMYSDNGTNFVGAAKVLEKDFQEHKTFTSEEFHEEINKLHIEWHFNCPLWPSAGGLWESGVKAMKYHLHRVLGEQKLTFEQFTTLLCQIEACLNSRPLCPLTEDIDELEYLTPGHFLVGGPILSPPHGSIDETINLRNRWKLIEQLNLHFWKRWSQECLHLMQVRHKWKIPTKNLEVGNVVLLKENNLPPGKWLLGRVIDLHPGADGFVRVVTLKTKNGQLKRPITKLAPLPLDELPDIKQEYSRSNAAAADVNSQETPEADP